MLLLAVSGSLDAMPGRAITKRFSTVHALYQTSNMKPNVCRSEKRGFRSTLTAVPVKNNDRGQGSLRGIELQPVSKAF
jgi:hypothetical protein